MLESTVSLNFRQIGCVSAAAIDVANYTIHHDCMSSTLTEVRRYCALNSVTQLRDNIQFLHGTGIHAELL